MFKLKTFAAASKLASHFNHCRSCDKWGPVQQTESATVTGGCWQSLESVCVRVCVLDTGGVRSQLTPVLTS